MKRCPKCNQEFVEEWLTFCTTDGTPLTDAPRTADYAPPPPPVSPPQRPVTAPQEDRPTIQMPSPQPGYGGAIGVPQAPQPLASSWQAPPAPFAVAPQQGLAIASLVLGLVSVTLGFCCSVGLITGPLAVGLGIFALVQIKNNPTQYEGKPLAIAGIATGGLYLVVMILLILFYGMAILLGGLSNLR